MPTYMGECGNCGGISEYYFGSGDPKRCNCPSCGTKFDLDGNRRYDLEGLQISGDTVAGGANLSGYYDEGLGEYVMGRRHRRRLMDEKGLQEYSPDPEMKKHRDEAKYIRENARPGDPSAAAAARKEYKTAANKRQTRLVEQAFKKAKI
jgi:hypothetical protein